MRILGFGTYDASAHPRVAVLLDGLRAHGHDVDECNVPLGLSTAQRVAMLEQPWRVVALGSRIATRWVRLARLSRRAPKPDVVLVGYLGHFDVLLARRLFPRTLIVLDHLVSGSETAADRQVGGSVAARALRRLDRAAIRAADVVVVDTEEHREQLPPERRQSAVVSAVGAESAWFEAGTAALARRPATAAGAPLRVVFFGLFTPLHGAPVIGSALALLADAPVEVTMIGHGQELDVTMAAAAGNTHVTWHSWVSPEELPPIVAGHDVCLGIFGGGTKALSVVPTKVFQGLAAGTVVVTSDTPPQRRVLGTSAVYVPPGDPAALASAIRDLAGDPERVRALRSASASAAASIAAADAVTADLSAALESRIPPAHPGARD